MIKRWSILVMLETSDRTSDRAFAVATAKISFHGCNSSLVFQRLMCSTSTAGLIRLLLSTKPYISPSRHDRAQDSLARGGNNQVVRENAGWSRSPRAQGSLFLMLGVLRRTGRHGGRERERERERDGVVLSSVASDSSVQLMN